MALHSFATVPRPAHVAADRVVDFDLYNPPDIAAGFHAAWKRLQDDSRYDVVWTPRNEGHWIALRSRVIAEVLNTPEIFSNRIILVPKSLGEQHRMLPTSLDPPEHRAYRAVITPTFMPVRLQGLEAKIRSVAIELVEQVRAQGGCNFTTAYAEQFPVRIVMALFGLPPEDAPRLKKFSDQFVRPDGSVTYAEIRRTFGEYLEPFMRARRERPEEDFLSDIARGRVDGRELSLDECMSFAVQILIAGLDTVVNFLGFMLLHLATHPADRALLVAEPARIPDAVEEFVRRFGLVSTARVITRDAEFHGVQLKEGEIMMAPTQLPGLDERENPDSMRVDFARPQHRHATFGQGPHHCVGAHLARAELRITLQEWLARIPAFELEPGHAIECVGGVVGCVRELRLRWDPATTRG
jgi:cytochrome P450